MNRQRTIGLSMSGMIRMPSDLVVMGEGASNKVKLAYPKTRRDDCICNICRKEVPSLSDDHIPPKGAFKQGKIRIHCYPESHQGEKHVTAISHNGLKFRTICSDCNNLLGGSYDVHLNKFLNRVASTLSSPLILPSPLLIKGRPTAIIKAVLGHILAAKTGFCNSGVDRITREYLFDDNAVLPENVRVFFWYYPHSGTIISTDRLDADLLNGGSVLYSVLKYYPLAFLVMEKGNGMSDSHITELTKYNHNDLQKEVDLPVYLHYFPKYYPESNAYNNHMARLVVEDRTDIQTVDL